MKSQLQKASRDYPEYRNHIQEGTPIPVRTVLTTSAYLRPLGVHQADFKLGSRSHYDNEKP